MIDESGARGDVAVVGERRVLAQEGTVTAILIVSAKTGQIIAGPDLVSRGLVSGDGTSEHMRRARNELAARLNDIGGPYRAGEIALKDEVVRTVRGYFSDELGKRPLVVAHVVEV
jgi:ribonuclease J